MFFLSSITVIVETIIMLQQSVVKFDTVKTQDYSGLIRYVIHDTLKTTT